MLTKILIVALNSGYCACTDSTAGDAMFGPHQHVQLYYVSYNISKIEKKIETIASTAFQPDWF